MQAGMIHELDFDTWIRNLASAGKLRTPPRIADSKRFSTSEQASSSVVLCGRVCNGDRTSFNVVYF